MTCLRSQASKLKSPHLNSGLSNSSLSRRNPFGGKAHPEQRPRGRQSLVRPGWADSGGEVQEEKRRWAEGPWKPG